MNISITKTQNIPNNIPVSTINLTSEGATTTVANSPNIIDITEVDKSVYIFDDYKGKYIRAL